MTPIRFTSMLAVLALGCAAPPTTRPLLFKIEPGGSRAYVSRDHLSIYLVGDPDVLVATLTLPPSEISRMRTAVTDGESDSLIRHSGPDAARLVLPRGGAAPPGTSLTRARARAGFIVCRNVPMKGSFAYGREITVSLEAVDFGDGAVCASEPVTLIVEAFPP